jgi:cyclic-di-GMP-binding protein
MRLNETPPKPFVSSVNTGRGYIASLPLDNPTLAHTQLLEFIEAMIATPPELSVFAPILELCREPLDEIQEALGKRFHGKSIPLPDEEERWFGKVLAGWSRMSEAYGLCAQMSSAKADEVDDAEQSAQLLHRHIYYTGLVVFEHYRARRELPEGAWLKLHYIYETAEKWGIATLPVRDFLENPLQPTHCSAAYVALLLLEIASPYNTSVRDLNLVRHWAGLWSPMVSIHPVDNDMEVPPYVVDLDSDSGLHAPATAEHANPRHRQLDTSRLGPEITKMLGQLHDRVAPAELGLGQETTGHSIGVLKRLSRPWQQQASPRRFRRFNSQGKARIAVDFPAIHYHLTGVAFAQPEAGSIYSREGFDKLYTFGDRVDRGSGLAIENQPAYATDDWEVINHSANGFRLSRSCAGQRITLGQLLAICPHDGEQFLLAQVTWLMQTRDDGLIAGVSVLPGIPIGIGARYVGTGHHGTQSYNRAFLMPSAGLANDQPYLVLPAGMYQGGRMLEINTGGESLVVQMQSIVTHGVDFDRVAYLPA